MRRQEPQKSCATLQTVTNSDHLASTMSPDAVDTHMHFYGEGYPVAGSTVLRPPPATVDDYEAVQERLGCRRVVVVQPTTYGLDNSCQLDAMTELRRRIGVDAGAPEDPVRGIAVVNAGTDHDELQRLNALGVRGARFHMLPGGAVDWGDLTPVADAVSEFGWHIQLQLNGRELAERLDGLLALATPLVVDHVGRFMPPVPVDDENFGALCALLDRGNTWVKLSAPYESSVDGPPGYDDTALLARELLSRYPERMLWASNWPHPGQDTFPSPDDLDALLRAWIPEEQRHQVLVANPAALYGFER